MTVTDLAKASGLSRATITKIEAGNPVDNVTMLKVLKIISAEQRVAGQVELSNEVESITASINSKRRGGPIHLHKQSALEKLISDIDEYMTSGKIGFAAPGQVSDLIHKLEYYLDALKRRIDIER
jgi:transcriptional regulator with XRE-family HTH domain